MNDYKFPEVGNQLKFKGVPKMYYPMFTNMRTYANENLEVGLFYKVARAEVYSSWCAVWLEGHGDNYLNFSFFEFAT